MTAMETEITAASGAPRQTLAMRLAERNRQRALRAERLAKLRTLGPEAPEVSEAAPGAAPEMVQEAAAFEAAPASAGDAPEIIAPEITTPEIIAGPAAAAPEVVPVPEAIFVPDVAASEMPAAEMPAAEMPASEMPAAAVLAGPQPVRDREADDALADFLRALTGGVAPAPAPLPAEPGAILHFQRPADRPDPETAARMAASDLGQLPGAGPGLVWALGRAGLDSLAAIAPLAPAELADRLGPLGRLVPAERWIATARAALPDAPSPAP